MSGAGRAALLDLLDTAAAATLVLDRALARIGLGADELRVLSAVAAGGPAGTSISSAAGALSVPGSAALRRVRPLEKLGWIERLGPAAFILTESGQGIEAEGRDICADATERYLESCFSSAERETLSALLAKTGPAPSDD
ncbi:MarR family winged helix-turn-helix transcriptional regulator [Specibacter sp. AOP5-B1-6]|uniref:MarR family winged helix-turn-helix transcriptional regulator n=1 Tax=Specibacter sp. AOP5-B1-6 TaxID=3457653 RepID=UPI00402B4220